MGRRRKPLPQEPIEFCIDDLSHDGRGVARHEGKVVFVEDALPGERVQARLIKRTRQFDIARTVSVDEPAAHRTEPRCPHFGVCGGCALQHMDADAQLEFKANTLIENLRRIGQVSPEAVLSPLSAERWGYRRRARLSVRHVAGKGRTLVGFRERDGRFVADIRECHVLIEQVGFRLDALSELVDSLEARDQIPQIEVAAGDESVWLVFRHMAPLSQADRDALARFSAAHGLGILLQPKGPKTLETLDGAALPALHFSLPEHDLQFRFTPTNFVQVNASANRLLVERALDLLELKPEHVVLDLFCGLGNFTLPIARQVAKVLGVEGDEELVALARENAAANGLGNAEFEVADLTQPWQTRWQFDRILIDPPRSGAEEVLATVASLGAPRIVYVSCHPGSLARDAGILVAQHGYRLRAAGAVDMFPHTAHVESIAVFERGD